MLRKIAIKTSVILACCLTHALHAQDFAGLRIGSSAAAVMGMTGLISMDTQGRDRFAKWRRADGHELSVTTRDGGPIVYMESNRNPGIAPLAGPGLRFGLTRRGDLRALLGNDGFAYASRDKRVLGDGSHVIFHSYELADQRNIVVTFAFLLPSARANAPPDTALLDGLIVAERWYLDEIWGAAMTVSADYAPITMSY